MGTTLDITGYAKDQVPNEFLRSDQSSRVLAILLPGKGYTTSMPLLFYAENLSFYRNWDVLRVNYNYLRLDISGEEIVSRLVADTRAAIEAGLRQGNYSNVVVFGKSLGTIAMANSIDLLANKIARWIWMTPLLKVDEVHQAIQQSGSDSIAVIGTADSQFDSDVVADLAHANVRSVVVKNADHGMGIEGDVPASIAALGTVFSEIDNFLVGFGE